MQSSEALEERLVIPPQVRHRTRRWVVAIAVAVLGGLGLLAFFPRHAQPARYRTAPVERRTVIQVVEASGRLDVVRRVEVPAPGPGQVQEILVHDGDRVKYGQALARLDERSATIALRAAKAGLSAAASRIAEAAAALAAATDTRKRTEGLLERGLASPSDLAAARAAEQKARSALAAARAERDSATQSVESAELTQSLTTIAAPLDGVVLRVPDSAGAAVTPEHGPLFVIGSPLQTLRIDAEVAESEIAQVLPGKVAHFTVPAFPGRSFDARVERTGVDARRSGLAVRYPVELSVENRDDLLLPGMTTTLRIEIARIENALAVREAALRFQPEGAEEAPSRSRVWKVTSSGVEPIPVSAGLSDGAFTAIGVAPGAALALGDAVALGTLKSEPQKTSGPGIRLGKR